MSSESKRKPFDVEKFAANIVSGLLIKPEPRYQLVPREESLEKFRACPICGFRDWNADVGNLNPDFSWRKYEFLQLNDADVLVGCPRELLLIICRRCKYGQATDTEMTLRAAAKKSKSGMEGES